MAEISGTNDFAEWLKEKPAEWACLIAARIALRVVPILRDALYKDEEARRARIVLPSFRALAAGSFAGAWPDQFGDMRQAAHAAARGASDAMEETYNESQINVIDSMEAVPEAHLYIHEMEMDRDALGVASHTVDAILRSVRAATDMLDANSGIASIDAVYESGVAAGKAAEWAVDGANGYEEFQSALESDRDEKIESPPHVSTFWKAVQWDAVFLEKGLKKQGKPTTAVEDLSKLALWHDRIPVWASRRWAGLKDDLPAGEGWSVWTDWYEARLIGKPGNSLLELERVIITEDLWEQGPAAANKAIENLIGSSESQSNGRTEKLVKNRDYQVALSFAGEQRDYVDEVARHLAARSIALFYDGFEQSKLWGQDGVEAFHGIYAERATYVVMFISKEYATKPWTRLERRSALSRMLKTESEYILPVRFDDTQIPGLPDTVFYLKAADFSPAELCARIAQKLGIRAFDGKASDVPPPQMTSPVGEVVFDYGSFNGRYIIGSGVAEFETKWSKASNRSIHVYNDPSSINGVALARDASTIHEITTAAALDYTSRTRTPTTAQVVVLRNGNGFYAAVQMLNISDETRGDGIDQLRFRYAIQTDGTDNFASFRDTLEN